MRKFITKTAFFVLPFLLFFIIKSLFFSSSESPDLIRLGCLPNIFKDYRSTFNTAFNRKIYYKEFSKTKNKKAKILTIGDSFSEQGTFGYKNYLAEKHSVISIDRFLFDNQIQTLYEFLNGDFFEKHTVEYVVLQNVERFFVSNTTELDTTKAIFTIELNKKISNHKPSKVNTKDAFFEKKTLQFPFSMMRYYVDRNYLSNKYVYNVDLTTNKLFSVNSNKLFFFHQDLSFREQDDYLSKVQRLNDVLNDLAHKLNRKHLKLIVLPAPDKYDLYYNYIADKTGFPKPMFFDYLAPLKKDYIYIDSKKILSAELERKKDIYFYDDTHWSPVASKIISEEILKVIH